MMGDGGGVEDRVESERGKCQKGGKGGRGREERVRGIFLIYLCIVVGACAARSEEGALAHICNTRRHYIQRQTKTTR